MGLMAVGCLVAMLTWGFDVVAYGREQRVSGFLTWEECNTHAERMRETRPGWVVKDCTLDRQDGWVKP